MSSSRRPRGLIVNAPFKRFNSLGSGSPARCKEAVPFTTRTDSNASLAPPPVSSAATLPPGPLRTGMEMVGRAERGVVSSGYPSQDPFSPCRSVAWTPSRCAATTILN